MADIKISELERVQSLNNGDLVEVSQEDTYSETGYSSKSAKMTDIGEKVVNGIEYTSELNTSNKKIIGAINEIASYTPVYGNTASGAIATFDTSLALPLQDCTIAINAVQEAGTPTPSSPKAITGFTGANIHVADNENPHIIDNVTPITWQSEAGTVYGGSLDVTTGILTITRGFKTVTSNDTVRLFGSLNSNTVRAGIVTSDMKMPTWNNTSEELDIFCNIATPNTDALHASTNAVEGQCCMYKDGSYPLAVFTLPSSCSTVNLALTELVNNGCGYCYPLATPVTYQLTPTQISAIVGTNNIFTDTNGNTSVVYACSLKDYIDRQ